MTDYFIKALNPESHALESYPLPLDRDGARCSLKLRALPGADGIHLQVSASRSGSVLRAEAVCVEEEEVVVRLLREGGGVLSMWRENGDLWHLPAVSKNAPAAPIIPRDGKWDVALVVDGTLRRFFRPPSPPNLNDIQPVASAPLVGDSKFWPERVEALVRWIDGLTGGVDGCRFSVVAFGDQRIPGAASAILRPPYLVRPERVQDAPLRPLGLSGLRAALMDIPPASGADFVDGLADALELCTGLSWQSPRRLLVIFGDSPGHSLQFPAPPGADAQIRRCDLDTAALRLHRQGVEIVSLYVPPSPELLEDLKPSPHLKKLLEFTRKQYGKLGSSSAHRLEEGDLSRIEETVVPIQCRELPLGRGAAWGVWVEAVAEDGGAEEPLSAGKDDHVAGEAGQAESAEFDPLGI